MAITVKPLEPSDIPRIMEIEHASFDPEVCEEACTYRNRIATCTEGSLGFFTGELLIGFFCSERWDREERYGNDRFSLSHDPGRFHDPEGTELYISSFAIDRTYRNRLSGRQAFSLAMNRMTGTGNLHSAILLVADHWHAAKAIYSGWGFTEAWRIPACFPDTEGKAHDGIVMRSQIG